MLYPHLRVPTGTGTSLPLQYSFATRTDHKPPVPPFGHAVH